MNTPATQAFPTSETGHASLNRRDFLKTSALLGGSTLLATALGGCVGQPVRLPSESGAGSAAYPNANAATQLYSVCLNCNTGCGIKAKIENGVVAKIDGNPFSPWTMHPSVPYATSVFDTARVDAPLCPKGQAGVLTAYDPYRITRVLKRAGPRGSNKWISIPFDQAITEIVEGGLLFKHVAGEETRQVTGLKEIYALRDPKIAQALAADAAKVAKKQMTLEAFKAKHGENLKYLIDPDHPDFGPINNQFVFNWGRLKGGRAELISRFTRDAFGSTNAHGHTTVCQGSLYFTGKAMSEQYTDGKWTGGKKFYWQADTPNSEFVLFVGASPMDGNYGPPRRVPSLTNGVTEGRLKFAVVDPRFSKTAAKAWKWLPNIPGTEGALALGMIRWIIEQKRYDARFLANANKAAAAADKEPSWSNASWLVKIEKGVPGGFLRASDLKLPTETRQAADGSSYTFDPFVVMGKDGLVTFDPYDTKTAVEGELFFAGEVNGIPVKTGLQLIKESAEQRTLEEVARITGLKVADIVEVARELTAHGKKAAVDIHRGVSQHTNGFYNVLGWYTLNALLGNYDWAGGLSQAATYAVDGSKPGQPYPVTKVAANKAAPWGISIIRHDVKYEETTLFTGSYPAKRPFYPLASDIYQEVIPSIGDAYPYPVKALFLYMGSPVYALPAGHKLIEILADTSKLPLFVANDIVIGETSMYADYIFPDVSYLERWEFHGSHPSIIWKVQPVRQPAIAPIPEEVEVSGQKMPICLESFLMALAEHLGLPGSGEKGFANGMPFTHMDHFYLKLAANLAFGEKADGSEALPEASEEELRIFRQARRHLPPSVFDERRWREAVGDESLFRRTVYLLNRGGRFQEFAKAYAGGDLVANPYGKQINLFLEKQALSLHPMTGRPYWPLPAYFSPYQDALGRQLRDPGYGLTLLTHRDILMTKSRTVSNYWLRSIKPENAILVNAEDAKRLGLRDGQLVKVVSATNPKGEWDLGPMGRKPMVGRVKVVQGLRPGCVAFPLGWGHWGYGATDLVVNGQVIKGDPRRAMGVHANAAMRLDPYLKDMALTDTVGGSVVFYETKVNLLPV